MNNEPTLDEVIEVLDEIEQAMDDASDPLLVKLSALYTSAYSFKLHLMAKETQRAGR